MKSYLIFPALAGLALTGCYTQLASGGYARKSVEPAYGYAQGPAPAADSAATDSLAGEGEAEAAQSRPQTVIVNNYWRESPYYRGYAIDAWDYPGFTLGFYSAGYRSYHHPYWWERRHGYHGGHRYHGGYRGGTGGGTVISGPSGDYKSDKRIFAPDDGVPELRKGRRSESAPSPAPKASEPAPASTETAPAASADDSGNRESSPTQERKSDRPRPQKGKRR